MSYSVLTIANLLIKYLGVCLSISMAKCFALQTLSVSSPSLFKRGPELQSCGEFELLKLHNVVVFVVFCEF